MGTTAAHWLCLSLFLLSLHCSRVERIFDAENKRNFVDGIHFEARPVWKWNEKGLLLKMKVCSVICICSLFIWWCTFSVLWPICSLGNASSPGSLFMGHLTHFWFRFSKPFCTLLLTKIHLKLCVVKITLLTQHLSFLAQANNISSVHSLIINQSLGMYPKIHPFSAMIIFTGN